jgi:hypothetical protein
MELKYVVEAQVKAKMIENKLTNLYIGQTIRDN